MFFALWILSCGGLVIVGFVVILLMSLRRRDMETHSTTFMVLILMACVTLGSIIPGWNYAFGECADSWVEVFSALTDC